MEIIAKSIHVIDFEQMKINYIEPSEAFEDYVNGLVSDINEEPNIRQYFTPSKTKEVISCILQIKAGIDSGTEVGQFFVNIAQRLLMKEKETQDRMGHMDVHVQKGSLIQVLLHDETTSGYIYLLAKVDHSGFVDDSDFTLKSGFSREKKSIWKTCAFDLSAVPSERIPAKVYSNTYAKYWWDDFLELEPVITNEENTSRAFKAIDHQLSTLIKKRAPFDHTVLRNMFVGYFQNHDQLVYDDMLKDIMDGYTPNELSPEGLSDLKQELSQLPEKKHFDRNFTPIPSEIKARIRKTYKIRPGMELRITDSVDNISDVISAQRGPDGDCIVIKTTEKATFERFFRGH